MDRGVFKALKQFCGSKAILKKHYCQNELDTFFMPFPFWSIGMLSAGFLSHRFQSSGKICAVLISSHPIKKKKKKKAKNELLTQIHLYSIIGF